MKTLLQFVVFVARQLWKHIRSLHRFSISCQLTKNEAAWLREGACNIKDVVKLSKSVQLYGMLHEGEAPEVCSYLVLQGS